MGIHADRNLKTEEVVLKGVSLFPYPVGAPYIGRILEPVLLEIINSGLDHHVGPISTTVEGSDKRVSRLIRKCEKIIYSHQHPSILGLKSLVTTDSHPGMQKGELRRRIDYINSILDKAGVPRR